MFPTAKEISHIVRNRITDPKKYIGATFAPLKPVYADSIEYDELDAAVGMTAVHNLDTDPKLVPPPSGALKRMGTGYFKETVRFNEKELLTARRYGTYNERAGRELIVNGAVLLDTRLETRLEYLRWQAVTNGKIELQESNIAVNYNLPGMLSRTGTKKWGAADADPVADISDLIENFIGTGTKCSTIYLTSKTARCAAESPKMIELLKQSGFAMLLSMHRYAECLKSLFPAIEFVIYDEGYAKTKDDFKYFLPEAMVVAMGDSEDVSNPIMDFASTISLHNGGLDKPQPGKFSLLDDKSTEKNPFVDVTVGLYGLPRIFKPKAIQRLKV
jgi:Phage major capsid protein E.